MAGWRYAPTMPPVFAIMPQDSPAIQQFLQKSGRLDLQTLEIFADTHNEQDFIRRLQMPVLMGSEVLMGDLGPRSGDATLFLPAAPSTGMRPVVMRPPLMHLIYPFIKRNAIGETDSFSLGRSENNDFVVPDYTVAKTQAQIRRTAANRYLLRGIASTNPTLLNGKYYKNTEVFLHDEDRLTLGRYEFIFLSPSALYCRLKGMELRIRIERFLDSLGKADHDALKNYAIRHGQKMFVQLVTNPSLVGSGLFRGYSLDRSSEDPDSTLAFLPDLTMGPAAKHLKLLERAVYPLVPPEIDSSVPPPITIGRAESNQIIMPEGSVSNVHATITFLGPGQYHLADVGSTNGTSVNDKPLSPLGKDLADGDRIKLGRFEFLFLFPGSLYLHITPENTRRG
ncbi:MAG: FHA domain-containing protein [Magnetococcales bacterium]|nr:FHA domain-containing protein [Magnetococcales bacterium]